MQNNPDTKMVAADINSVAEATRLVDTFCNQHQISLRDKIGLRLIIEELVTNTLRYGSTPNTAPIKVVLDYCRDHVVVRYTDFGIPFNPLSDAPHYDIEAPIEKRLIGGLGWRLIRYYSQSIKYSRENSKNQLVLVKNLDYNKMA